MQDEAGIELRAEGPSYHDGTLEEKRKKCNKSLCLLALTQNASVGLGLRERRES